MLFVLLFWFLQAEPAPSDLQLAAPVLQMLRDQLGTLGLDTATQESLNLTLDKAELALQQATLLNSEEPDSFPIEKVEAQRQALQAQVQFTFQAWDEAVSELQQAESQLQTLKRQKERLDSQMGRLSDQINEWVRQKNEQAAGRNPQDSFYLEVNLFQAESQHLLRRIERNQLATRMEAQAQWLSWLKEKAAFMKPRKVFTAAERDQIMTRLNQQIDQAKKHLQEARDSLDRWGVSQLKKPAETRADIETERPLRQTAVNQAAAEVQRLNDRMQIWQNRYVLAQEGPSPETIRNWAIGEKQDELTREAQALRDRIHTLRQQLADRRSQNLDGSQPDSLLTLLERNIGLLEDELSQIDRHQFLAAQWADEAQEQLAHMPFRDQFQRVKDALTNIWHFEIATVEDKTITIKTLVLGLVILILGIWSSKRLSQLLGKYLLKRFALNQSATAAIQTIAFYIMVLTFTLLALQLVNIPLTIFTVLGGAIAIGVGFGSQNIMNNFISGLILLAERPIRIGDLIQIGDLFGHVMAIGARSTRIRSSNGIDIIVPNSTFLEQNVVNWTLSDNRYRAKISVGVAYGSDTKKLASLLRQAADEHPKIQKEPAPIVLFTDFGDNALVFDLHCWIIMQRMMDRWTAESDLRFRIDELCRENDIVIAFPQRDVHLDTLKPLEIKLVNEQLKD